MTIFMVMKMISIAELKAQATRVIRRVEAGETYTVTRRNKPVVTVVACAGAIQNKTQLGFDSGVRILGDLNEPVLTHEEWGDLYPE